MPLNDIVNVVITRQTQSVTEQGFGTPMILGTHNRFTDLIRFYSDMQGVAEDFTANDQEYIAAQDIFSQEISPDRIAIGRRQVDEVEILVASAIEGKKYTIIVNGKSATYTALALDTKDDIATGLEAAINAITPALPVTVTVLADLITVSASPAGTAFSINVSTDIGSTNEAIVKITQVFPGQEYFVKLNGVEYAYTTPLDVQTSSDIALELVNFINTLPQSVDVTATDNDDGSFQIASNISTEIFSISVSPEKMSVEKGLIIQPLVAVNLISEDLDAINNADSSWYALILTDRDEATVLATADWIESQMKLFGTASNDTDIIDVSAGTDLTSIAAVLSQLGYQRTFVMYHQDALTDYPEAAWFGRVLPLEPGSETWKFKNLNGVSYSKLTTNQSNNALNKNANTYEFVAGVGITAEGTVALGEFIDIIRGIDWLTSRIQEFVFSVLVNNEKVAYTDAGIATIQAEVMRVLSLGVGNDFLASDPAPVVTVPLAIDVPMVDKNNRILKNVRFQATLSGALHFVQIRGNLTI